MKVVAGASLPDLRALMVASDLGGTALARLLLGYGAATDATVVSCGIRRFLAMQFFSLKSSPPPRPSHPNLALAIFITGMARGSFSDVPRLLSHCTGPVGAHLMGGPVTEVTPICPPSLSRPLRRILRPCPASPPSYGCVCLAVMR